MNRLKLFLENFIVYGLSGIVSKVIPLIMVPIVTRLMPNSSYYGVSDMSNTVIQFCSAFALMGMYDAMYRMFFEKDDEIFKKSICSTAFLFSCITSFIVFLLMLIFRNIISEKFFGDTQLSYLVYITAMATLVGATNSIVSAPTRMQNKRKIYVIMNFVTPLISYSISIPLLLKGHYLIALPLANLIASFLSEFTFLLLNKSWFDFSTVNLGYLKSLLKIGIPLLPNFLIYWVFNSCDRLMITNMLGTTATGIYSVGAKLGMCSQLIYTAFAGGWQYFAFSTMNEKDQVDSNTRIFEYLGIISFICTFFVFSLAHPIYKLLFKKDYVLGYIVSPYLFLAPLLQMLFQVASNQFLIIKKTWPNFLILSLGAVINILFNLFMIPKIGIEGAAVASMLGYAVSVICAVMVLQKMKLMNLQFRFIIASILLIIFIFIWKFVIYESVFKSLFITVLFSFILLFLYRADINKMIYNIKNR